MTTSYFAKLNKIPYPIAICLYPPKFYKGKIYLPLAPDYQLLNDYKKKYITDEDYTYRYNLILKELDPYKVYDDLKNMHDTEDCTLLCYEKPTDFCHRHLVANWFLKHKLLVKELTW